MIKAINSKLFFSIALVTFLGVLFLLITGSPVLTYAVDSSGKIPSGTPVTWLGLISFPALILLGVSSIKHPGDKFYVFLKRLLILTFILAILWVPVCYLLAGNLSFTFSERAEFQGGQSAMKLFWIYTYSIPALSLTVLILHWLNLLVRAVKRGLIRK